LTPTTTETGAAANYSLANLSGTGTVNYSSNSSLIMLKFNGDWNRLKVVTFTTAANVTRIAVAKTSTDEVKFVLVFPTSSFKGNLLGQTLTGLINPINT
jgi:hypothetical protein